MSTQIPTDLINQAVQAFNQVVPALGQAAGQVAQQVAAQPAVQQAARDLGQQAGAGAREGAVGGLDATTIALVTAGGVALLGVVGYAAYRTGRAANTSNALGIPIRNGARLADFTSHTNRRS